MITAGVDCGAENTKTVVLKDGRVLGRAKVLTGFDQEKAAGESMEQAMAAAGVERQDIKWIGVTGSGSESIRIAQSRVNEITALSRASRHFFPGARTAADVGAEEGRAVLIDENGNVADFAVNEKCAAGAGAFVQTMARALEVSVEEMGLLSLQSDTQLPMNAHCVVFAESEVVGLIHSRTPKQDISKAVHDAVAGRIAAMIRRVGVHGEVVLMGGMACNPGFTAAVMRELKLEEVRIPESPEYGAAVGAALAAAEDAGHGESA